MFLQLFSSLNYSLNSGESTKTMKCDEVEYWLCNYSKKKKSKKVTYFENQQQVEMFEVLVVRSLKLAKKW